MADLTAASQLLGNLRSDGFSITLEGDELVLSHLRRSPSAGELAGVRQFKGALIELLREPERAGEPGRTPSRPPAPRPAPPDDWRLRSCSCSSCAEEDARERDRRLDPWRGL